MLDPNLLRQKLEATVQALANRGYVLDAEAYAKLEAQRKTLQIQTEELQAERNRTSKSIGQAKARGEDIEPILAQVASLKQNLEDSQTAFEAVHDTMQTMALVVVATAICHNSNTAKKVSDATTNRVVARFV